MMRIAAFKAVQHPGPGPWPMIALYDDGAPVVRIRLRK